MNAHTETINQFIQNPGSLQNFQDNGGTCDEWHDRLDAFRSQQTSGFTDTQLLSHAGIVNIEQIDEEVDEVNG